MQDKRQDVGASAHADRAAAANAVEEWRFVPGYGSLYDVSNFGRVRSFRWIEPRYLSPGHDKDGYPFVKLTSTTGERRHHFLHRLVAQVFLGDGENALHNEVAHLDGNKLNPRADNLKWVSRVENHFHMRAHGTHPAGERHPQSKLTEQDVQAIRSSDANCAELGRRFGVSQATVYNIKKRIKWRSVADAQTQPTIKTEGGEA